MAIKEEDQDEDSYSVDLELPPSKMLSKITIGDVSVCSKANLIFVGKVTKRLLRDRTIRNYLRGYGIRKLKQLPSYVD